jgi:hypothetical protein
MDESNDWESHMKQAAWAMALVVGMTSCNGALIGGDMPVGLGRSTGGNDSGVSGGESPGPNRGAAGSGPPVAGDLPGTPTSGSSGGDPGPGIPTLGLGGSGGDLGPGIPTLGLGGSHGDPLPPTPTSLGGTGGGDWSCRLPGGGAGGNYPGYLAGSGGGDTRCSSPIDAWIAFDMATTECNRDVYVIRPDGSRLTALTVAPSMEAEPYFSPNGDRLSFTSDRNGSPQIYILELASGAVTQVTHRRQGAEQSSFSADGQLLAFRSAESIYTIRPDGSEETLIATFDDTNAAFSQYSHPRFVGNDQLVFGDTSGVEINVINLDRTELRKIVSNPSGLAVWPSVSPHSDEIAYTANCPGESRLSTWTAAANVSTSVCSGVRVSPADDLRQNLSPSWGPEDTFAYRRIDSAAQFGRIVLNKREPGSLPCSLTEGLPDSGNPNWSAVGLRL